MALHHSPSIVTNGLILCLDASNIKSYPGTGTTWTDMSLSRYSATLANGTTYSNGAMVFDGIDDYVSIPGSVTLTSATFIFWIKRNGNQGNYDGIFYSRGGTGGSITGISFYSTTNNLSYTWNEAANTYSFNSGLTVPDNSWCMCAVSINATSAVFHLFTTSGLSIATNTVSHASTTLAALELGRDNFQSRYMSGSISMAMLYNRALTTDEIIRNYNTLKSRFETSIIPIQTASLYSWGWNYFGQLGDGTTTTRSSPGTVAGGGTDWAYIFSSWHSGGIKSDGTLWTWGSNAYGQLGTGNTTSRSSPGTVAGGGTTWASVSGALHTAAIKTDGTLWTWGGNLTGELGDGTTTSRSSPATVAGGGTTWSKVVCGATTTFPTYTKGCTFAIKTDGTLWSWGYNGTGQLGDGTTTNKSSPVTVAGGGTTWASVSVSRTDYRPSDMHVAAIKTDGTLWTWGVNTYGNLGTGDTANRSSPVTVAGGGTNWKQVACGGLHTAAVKTDGTIWTWGFNSLGQLGDGTTSNRSSPVTVAGGGTNWNKVSAADRHILSIKTDGSMWGWGLNDSGNLGTGSSVSLSHSSPVSVVGGLNWKSVEVGSSTMAIS